MCMLLFEETTASWFILHFFAFNTAHHYNMQDLGILEVDLRVLELDLRLTGGLGLSPPIKFSTPIGLRPSPPLNLISNSKVLKSHCKTSDFGFSLGLELPSPYLELVTWMLEEYLRNLPTDCGFRVWDYLSEKDLCDLMAKMFQVRVSGEQSVWQIVLPHPFENLG